MKTVHFVYALPRLRNTLGAIIQKASRKLFHRQMKHGQIGEYKWPRPLRAPQSITYNVAKLLGRKFNVRLYDLTERIKIRPADGDILLGHMWPDRESIMWQSLEDASFSARYLIGPYNNDANQIGWMRTAVEVCDKFFAICGDYWVDHLSSSPFCDLSSKIVHLNMAVNANEYPVVKQRFSKPGERRFLYIGRIGSYGDEKGVHLLEEFAASIPNFQGGYICGGGVIKGWRKICDPTNLTAEFMREIAGDYDFFINMSRADAQATTVLEAMCWGFPVLCTNQTGYSRDERLLYLSLDDMSANIEMIKAVQFMPEEELREIALANRKQAEMKYNWRNFESRLDESFRS